MKYLKLGGIVFFIFFFLFGIIFLKLDISNQLILNIKKNLYRSFKNSGMHTQIKDLDVTILPSNIKWSMLKIERTNSSDLPNSWLHIFQNIEFSNCNIKVSPYWFKIKLDLNCSEIDLGYIPLKWFFVTSLNRKYALDFFFTKSDFNNLESKQGFLKTTIKVDNLSLNGKAFGPLNLSYFFKTQKELWITMADSKDKIILRNIPWQLEINFQDSGKRFGLLNKSFYFEILKIL